MVTSVIKIHKLDCRNYIYIHIDPRHSSTYSSKITRLLEHKSFIVYTVCLGTSTPAKLTLKNLNDITPPKIIIYTLKKLYLSPKPVKHLQVNY